MATSYRSPLIGTPTSLLAVRRETRPDDRLEQVDRDREHRRGVVLGRDLGEGLEVAELHRERLRGEDPGGLGELLAGLELAFGVDDLGAALALGFRLARDGA